MVDGDIKLKKCPNNSFQNKQEPGTFWDLTSGSTELFLQDIAVKINHRGRQNNIPSPKGIYILIPGTYEYVI